MKNNGLQQEQPPKERIIVHVTPPGFSMEMEIEWILRHVQESKGTVWLRVGTKAFVTFDKLYPEYYKHAASWGNFIYVIITDTTAHMEAAIKQLKEGPTTRPFINKDDMLQFAVSGNRTIN